MRSPTADPMLATYTPMELARLLGISTRSIHRHADGIPGALRVGNRVVFSKYAVDRWLQGSQPAAPAWERDEVREIEHGGP